MSAPLNPALRMSERKFALAACTGPDTSFDDAVLDTPLQQVPACATTQPAQYYLGTQYTPVPGGYFMTPQPMLGSPQMYYPLATPLVPHRGCLPGAVAHGVNPTDTPASMHLISRPGTPGSVISGVSTVSPYSSVTYTAGSSIPSTVLPVAGTLHETYYPPAAPLSDFGGSTTTARITNIAPQLHEVSVPSFQINQDLIC